MSSADMKRLGIEQGGESVSDELKVLVTGIAAFLAGLGLIELDDSELECSVSEVFDGIVAQIGCCKENEVRTSAVYTFKSVGELCDFCTCFPSAVLEKVVSREGSISSPSAISKSRAMDMLSPYFPRSIRLRVL
jgi:hypothetical protein